MDLPNDPSSELVDPRIATAPIKDPTLMQPAVKSDQSEIWQAETRAAAVIAINIFAVT